MQLQFDDILDLMLSERSKHNDLIHTIQKEVMNELSKYILSGKIDKSEAVVLDVFDGQIVFRKKIDDEALIEL